MPLTTEDRELALFRNLLEPPTEFRDGFGWKAVVGILFCGLVMLPGSIYLGLMIGGSFGAVASWVTVILFSEVSRRALKTMSKQELVVLLHVASVMVATSPGGPFGDLVVRAYYVTSDAVRDAGMSESLPHWWAPGPNSPAILQRNLLHPDWLIPIALMVFLMAAGYIKRYCLGYFFFRMLSDIEKLPFPLAPINAQGAMALAEESESAAPQKTAIDAERAEFTREAFLAAGQKKTGTKWRLFALGATIGLGFGFFQVGIPALTGLVLDKPVFLIPQPWIETTALTEGLLPATPTGISFDLGIVLIGMIIPFWAVVGGFLAVMLTLVLNPVLHKAGVLTHWQPGMDTINTLFANQLDFYLSFGIGMALGIAAVSIFVTVRDVRARVAELRQQRRANQPTENVWGTPQKGRGDFPLWMALAGYIVAGTATVVLCWVLLPRSWMLLVFIFLFVFVYNPLLTYINGRLLGVAGQTVDLPFVRETAFILSGVKGTEIWLAPIPLENYGGQVQSFRVTELTGVKFTSLVKVDLVALPVLYVLSFLFYLFIWSSTPIPSAAFPYAQKFWELNSKHFALRLSSTFVPPGEDPAKKDIRDSQFWKALKGPVILAGAAVTVASYSVLSMIGLPVLLVYGVVRGLGGIPHTIVLEIVGAMIGRYYFQKKFGAENFLRMIPTVTAGYFTGVGLVSMATIALNLIKQAVSGAPF